MLNTERHSVGSDGCFTNRMLQDPSVMKLEVMDAPQTNFLKLAVLK